MATSYYDLLKRPEWQRKRLEVMERAGFRCQQCRSNHQTLNVHHRYYSKGCKPWEYPDEVFLCLCEQCHKDWHDLMDKVKRDAGMLSKENLDKVRAFIRSLVVAAMPEVAGESLPLDRIYREGLRVLHDDYGVGEITDFWGGRLKIRFPAHGEKTFIADKVKLRIVGERKSS
jgi:hypothetical protein